MLSLRERLAMVNLYEELGSYRAVAALVGQEPGAWRQDEAAAQDASDRPVVPDWCA